MVSTKKTVVAASVAIAGVVLLAVASTYLFPSSLQGPVGTSSMLAVVPNSFVCTSYASCKVTVQNTGNVEGWISGAGSSSAGVSFFTCPGAIPAPGQTTFNIAISGSSGGNSVQGFLVQSTGDHLSFATTLPLTAPSSPVTTTCDISTFTNSTSSH